MMTADQATALQRVKNAADAAYAEGLSEVAIFAAVRAGIQSAKEIAAIFAPHPDDQDFRAA